MASVRAVEGFEGGEGLHFQLVMGESGKRGSPQTGQLSEERADMNAVRDNTTPSRDEPSVWGIAIVSGALVGFSGAVILMMALTDMKRGCNPSSSGASDEGLPSLLPREETPPFHCGFVSPDLNVALWAVVFGLVVGVVMTGVIRIRARRDVGDTGRGA